MLIQIKHFIICFKTGFASIYIDENGNNNIVIKGANRDIREYKIDQNKDFISSFDMIICQLEIPIK